MNDSQKKVLLLLGLVIAAMLLFPPFHALLAPGRVRNLGYHPIFDPPTFGSVNVSLLVAQWLGVAIVGCIALVLLKDRSGKDGDHSVRSAELPRRTALSGSKEDRRSPDSLGKQAHGIRHGHATSQAGLAVENRTTGQFDMSTVKAIAIGAAFFIPALVVAAAVMLLLVAIDYGPDPGLAVGLTIWGSWCLFCGLYFNKSRFRSASAVLFGVALFMLLTNA